MKLESISLKRSDKLNEKWVQYQIADNPSILQLGELVLRDRERVQPNSGRLDLLLRDPDILKRYEVEIQLGATDENHIIRTIEYWNWNDLVAVLNRAESCCHLRSTVVECLPI